MTIKLFLFVLLVSTLIKNDVVPANKNFSVRTSYYFSVKGDDKNDGSLQHPLKSISVLNTLHLNTGDSVLMNAGESFYGNVHLVIKKISINSFVLASYGNGTATIDAVNGSAIEFQKSAYVNITNINCKGSGRKNGNTKAGILFSDCNNIQLSKIDISGFQKSGVQLYNCINSQLNNIYAHDNGFAGISVEGDLSSKRNSQNIVITNCSAVNNPGDPSSLKNHSGNGIIVGHCTNVLIDHCMATNNGWDMPRIGNGPVGIWCYEADSVIIQHCISFQNKTSKGGEDGGGYDFDGGTTNSVIQYCLSYENYGSAFGIFQYASGSPWHNNVIRFCISENDGKISAAHAGAYIWNSSHDSAQFKNFLFYNNTIYNDSNAAISYSVESEHSNFKFYNNILIGAKEIIKGNYADDIFLANDWWSLKNGFNVKGNTDFKNWCITNYKEQLNGTVKAVNVMPPFKSAGNAIVTDADKLSEFSNYKIIRSSPILQAGLDLQSLFNIDTYNKDFNNQPINKKCIGACTSK